MRNGGRGRPLNSVVRHRAMYMRWPAIIIGALLPLRADAMSPGEGVVVDSETGNPIEGVVVELECRKNRFIHGSTLVDKFQVTTDARGRYSFSNFGLGLCDYAFVRPHKAGYVRTSDLDLGYGYTNYEEIPERLSLTQSSEATMKQLRYYFREASGGRFRDTPTHYLWAFDQFVKARRVASTEREIAFVRSSFCPLLVQLDSRFSDADRETLRRMRTAPPSPVFEMPDHDRVVTPYCG